MVNKLVVERGEVNKEKENKKIIPVARTKKDKGITIMFARIAIGLIILK